MTHFTTFLVMKQSVASRSKAVSTVVLLMHMYMTATALGHSGVVFVKACFHGDSCNALATAWCLAKPTTVVYTALSLVVAVRY